MKRSTLIVSILLGIVLLSIITIIVLVASQPAGRLTESGDVILLVPLSGSVAEDLDGSILGSSAGITPKFVRHQLENAEDNPNVKAIIFKVNSPGGTVGASQEIAELIQQAKKPVVIFAGDLVASAAYNISSQADKIVAKPGSLVGSIGVISSIPDLTGLYKKLGINMQVIKSGKNKDMFTRTLTPEEKQKFQKVSDELYNQFIDNVAKGRELKRDKVAELATGEVFPATVAKKLGLVDEVGGYQTAVDVAAKLAHVKDPVVDEYEPPTFFEELLNVPSSKVFSLVRMHLLGREFTLLENINNMYGAPQYKYTGGL